MELGASLFELEITATNPQASASFYAATFQLNPAHHDAGVACSAAGRSLRLVPGESGRLQRASFRFHDRAGFDAHRAALASRAVETSEQEQDAYTVRDPEGRRITFLAPADAGTPMTSTLLPARLQHFGVRSPSPARLADFYAAQLGFVESDRVLDDNGEPTAIFLRTDAEHHSMAIFRSAQVRFDHFSCEAPGWQALRQWADHMASVGVDLAWGIGRHGPGNDTFLMVKDPDGNLAEVSSDLETCAPDRPIGIWPHRPQTLNQWGVALMRS
ncbi:VOC family protein [Variovorax humicola]|uniref:VOC family protein n=1 Tax=Variovorax humicola TaxID=1769758 RepID=A0ABU8W246_9BURK